MVMANKWVINNIKKEVMMRDKLGVLFSGLCIAHCLLVPLMLLLLSGNVVLSALKSEWVHSLFLVPIFIIMMISLPNIWLKTRNSSVLIFALIGAVSLIASRSTHGMSEILLTLLGSSSLIAAHLVSLKLRTLIRAAL